VKKCPGCGLRFEPQIPTMANQRTSDATRKTNGSARKTNGTARKTTRSSFDALKEFEGKRYMGVKVGRGHHWRYDDGEWIEKKITPDEWEFRYTVTKRRKGRAPEGSGVPAGTEYHWYILADQTAKKVDANSYTTDMVGHKYKLAHKRADKPNWSASERARRNQLIKILKRMIDELEKQDARSTKESTKATSRAKRKPTAVSKHHRTGRHLAAA
jgi:hypothetical protein